MKKTLSLVLTLALLCVLFAGTMTGCRSNETQSNAYPVEGGNIYFDEATGAITDCDETVTSANIPAEINGVAVKGIGDLAFGYCYSLASVTIPDSVTSISTSAFSTCYELTGIWVDSDNTAYSSDENGVLFNKDKTRVVRCPKAYEGEYEIPDSVTDIGDNSFEGCTSLTSVTIPEGVTDIGYDAFSGCSSLASVTIPEGVTDIGGDAFESCTSLTSVTIPDSVTNIGSCVFYGCSSLTSVTIPDSVTDIGSGAFRGCTSLTSVTIPDSVTGIGDNAFWDCYSMESVNFMGNAPELGEGVFMTEDGPTLYYIEGESGWNTPEWNGYPTATWDPSEQN